LSFSASFAIAAHLSGVGRALQAVYFQGTRTTSGDSLFAFKFPAVPPNEVHRMAEGEPNDKPQPEGRPSDPSGEPGEIPRRRGLTPEQRRLLGAGRTLSDRPRSSSEPADLTLAAEPAPSGEVYHGAVVPHSTSLQEEGSAKPTPAGEGRPAAHPATVILPDRKSSRVFEMQKVAIIIGCLFLLGAIFYLGTRVPYWLYLYRSHRVQKQEQSVPDKFPGVSSDDLVEQALAAQEAGRWQEAAEQFLAARRKNNSYRGIFLRVGMMCSEHGDFDSADALYAKAIEFGENIDVANFFRSRIAVRRHDYAAGERFAEAAAMAAPFVWSNYYQWAEVLRLNHHPREAIRRYEQAERRAPQGLNAIACSYKARLARIEARDPKVGEEIAKRQSEGSLPADWVVTAAALKIDQGHFGDALQLLTEARAAATADAFSYYVSDPIFQNAAQSDPALAAICRINTAVPTPSP
jgi:tetratricopeptide (TPR) repeat protein